MHSIVHDVREVAKRARLLALEGRPQNEVPKASGWAATEAAIAELEAGGGEPVELTAHDAWIKRCEGSGEVPYSHIRDGTGSASPVIAGIPAGDDDEGYLIFAPCD